MGLNNKLNKKLKNEIHLIKKWIDKGSFIELHFGHMNHNNLEKIKKILDKSKFFKTRNVSIDSTNVVLDVFGVK